MAFYHGRGTAFWQPSHEDAKDMPVDPLALFPSEPNEPGRVVTVRTPGAELSSAIDLHELQGLALHLDQTCGRIEELAERTEGMLRRVELLSASATKSLRAIDRPRHSLHFDVAHRWTRLVDLVDEQRDHTKRELQAYTLLTRGALNRHVRRPLRDFAARWRKRAVVARVTSAIELEQLATTVLHAAAMPAPASPVRLVIRHPSLHAPERPAVVSASGGMMFAALVAGLVLVAAVPGLAPVVPAIPEIAPQRIASAAALGVLPDLFSALITQPSAPPAPAPPTPAASTLAPIPAPTATLAPAARDFVGTLTVESEPAGAAVFINQQFVGQTPVTLSDLRAGSRAVWIQSDGYQRWSAGVLVPADKETHINVKLQRDQHR